MVEDWKRGYLSPPLQSFASDNLLKKQEVHRLITFMVPCLLVSFKVSCQQTRSCMCLHCQCFFRHPTFQASDPYRFVYIEKPLFTDDRTLWAGEGCVLTWHVSFLPLAPELRNHHKSIIFLGSSYCDLLTDVLRVVSCKVWFGLIRLLIQLTSKINFS